MSVSVRSSFDVTREDTNLSEVQRTDLNVQRVTL